jgi:hypothetical protein
MALAFRKMHAGSLARGNFAWKIVLGASILACGIAYKRQTKKHVSIGETA